MMTSGHECCEIPKPPNVPPVAGCCCCCWGCPKMLAVPAAGWLAGCPKAPEEPNALPAIITCQKVSDWQRQDSYLLNQRHRHSRREWLAYSVAQTYYQPYQTCWPRVRAAAEVARSPRSPKVAVVVVTVAVEADQRPIQKLPFQYPLRAARAGFVRSFQSLYQWYQLCLCYRTHLCLYHQYHRR